MEGNCWKHFLPPSYYTCDTLAEFPVTVFASIDCTPFTFWPWRTLGAGPELAVEAAVRSTVARGKGRRRIGEQYRARIRIEHPPRVALIPRNPLHSVCERDLPYNFCIVGRFNSDSGMQFYTVKIAKESTLHWHLLRVWRLGPA